MKKFILWCMLSASVSLHGAEYIDGRIRLVLNEYTGRFSLSFMTDIGREQYLPFFVDADPRTSFLAVMADNRIYRLGESSAFKTRLGGVPSSPALIFESSFLTVTESFAFIKTGSSSLSNGVRITITVANRGERTVKAGIRFLIDTALGEGEDVHFVTDLRGITSEAAIDSGSADRYWVSRNSRLGLMGSVGGDTLTRPDLIHFANWKRLNDVPWKTAPVPGRNFNQLPYSVGDSAVCYYYEPAPIARESFRTIVLILSSEDPAGFAQNNLSGGIDDLSRLVEESGKMMGTGTDESIQIDLLTLRDLAARLDIYTTSPSSVTDEELAAIGLLVSKIRAKYGIP